MSGIIRIIVVKTGRIIYRVRRRRGKLRKNIFKRGIIRRNEIRTKRRARERIKIRIIRIY